MKVRNKNKLINIEHFKSAEYEKTVSVFEKENQMRIHKIVKDITKEIECDLFLDLGCGTGNVLRIACPYFKGCYGIDISKGMLNKAKVDDSFNLVIGDICKLPFKSETFDFVSAYAVLYYLSDPYEALSEANRVLKKGGILYLDHNKNYEHWKYRNIIYNEIASNEQELYEFLTFREGLKPNELKKYLEKMGFNRIKFFYRLSTHSNLTISRRLLLKILENISKLYQFPALYTVFGIIAYKNNTKSIE